MAFATILDEVREINLSYLMLAKAMIVEDKAEASFRLGISPELADLIASLSSAQLVKVAGSNTLLCRFRFDDQMVWDLITDHGRQASKDHGMGKVHAAILMAAQAPAEV
ncbi:MAG: flagellar transcriptional regulator FlhD [Burkholderiaceae bacterium]|jgi:flagellar transcriptional activator FlhD